MHTNLISLRRWSGLFWAGAALALPALQATAADAGSADSDAFPNYESYVKISGEAPFITGDHAAFATRNGLPNIGAYGIEDLYYTKDLSNETTFQVNGKALSGSEDYLASLHLATDKIGSVDMGYKRFRTFYDGVGGFFPLADTFQAMSPQSLHVDRGAFWIEGKLAKPNCPVLTISYRNETRTGQKDSSEWGATVNPNAVVANGALVGTAVPNNTPYISPNVMTMAEHHNIVDGSMTDTKGKVTEILKVTFDTVNNDDSRGYLRYPNSNVLADTATTILDDQETTKSNTFRILDQTQIKFNERLSLEVGLTYFHLSGTDGGEWITPAYNATANAIYNTVTAGNITASPKVDDYVGNLMLKYSPTANWLAEAGFREESNVISDHGGFIATSLATGATSIAASNVTTAQDVTYSHETDHVATPEFSVQYLGIRRLSLYATIDDRVNRGNQHWINPYAATTTTGTGVVTIAPAPIANLFYQADNQDNQDAKVGANWSAAQALSVRTEVFRKDHQNRFIGANDYVGSGSYGGLYATGYTFTGVKVTVTVKPIPEVTCATRYQQQDGKMAVTSNAVTGGLGTESPSGKASGQSISETIDWSPYRQLYFEGSINVVYNYIQTSYPTVVVVTTSPAVPVPFQNSNNNYITGSALCGFAVDKLTDAQIQGTWQQANNYNPQVALGGQPYGASFSMESITLGLKHKFTARLIGEAKVGYLRSTDGTTGSFTNYHGPLAYMALEFAL